MTVHDNSEYFEHRDWKRSMKLVNQELDFTWAASQAIDAGFEELRKSGVEIEVLENNAATVRPPWDADKSDDTGESRTDDSVMDEDDGSGNSR